MHVFGLGGVMALPSWAACCLRWCLRLDNSIANVVDLLIDLVMVAAWGALIGLTLGMSVGILRIGACGCMECVICLLSLVWGMGVRAGVCTLVVCCKYSLG